MSPVEDTPVHESVIKRETPYSACQKKVRKSEYWFMKRFFLEDGSFYYAAAAVTDRGSTACRYDRHASDPGCAGCQQPKDHEYLERMGRL